MLKSLEKAECNSYKVAKCTKLWQKSEVMNIVFLVINAYTPYFDFIFHFQSLKEALALSCPIPTDNHPARHF